MSGVRCGMAAVQKFLRLRGLKICIRAVRLPHPIMALERKIYPDYKSENGSVWIGRPLLMGSYYVMELSRSEGYELSVQGLNKAETNREADESVTVISSGSAWVKNGLSDHNSMEADGSWNDFTIESYDAENGYDITITGYPEHTRFYRLSSEERRENVKQIVNTVPQQKVDEHGTPDL